MYDRLKIIRTSNNLTQKEVAEAINVTRSSYSVWEISNEVIPLKHLVDFCEFFHISLDYFFALTDIKEYSNHYDIDNNKSKVRLKEFRKENNLTQKAIADLLNTNQSVIANYERGRTLIATPFLYEICKRYHVSADYLLGKIDEPKYI